MQTLTRMDSAGAPATPLQSITEGEPQALFRSVWNVLRKAVCGAPAVSAGYTPSPVTVAGDSHLKRLRAMRRHSESVAPHGESAAPQGESAAPHGESAAPQGESAAPQGESTGEIAVETPEDPEPSAGYASLGERFRPFLRRQPAFAFKANIDRMVTDAKTRKALGELDQRT